jgi:hypothetical protein
MTTKPTLQKILTGLIHAEEEDKYNHESTGNDKFQWKSR